MKVVNGEHISPFGGLNFVHQEFDRLKLDKLFAEHLPELSPQCKYNWRDLLYSLWSIYFCGGDSIEDLSGNLKSSLKSPLLKIPSADRVLDRIRSLSIPYEEFTSPRGKSIHQVSINEKLNRLNLKTIKTTNSSNPMVLDFDHTMIFNKKSDAKMTYKKQHGYMPGVGIIGNSVVYVENRNGNSDAQTLQEQTLERMFLLLKSEGIIPDIFRADSASYKLDTVAMIAQHVDKLYIKARVNEPVIAAIGSITNWKELDLYGQKVYRGSCTFTPFQSTAKKDKKEQLLKTYRLVVTKQPRDDGQLNAFSGEAYNYLPILTNEFDKSDDEVVYFYNQRGAIEKEFDVLKNDFGWSRMPFSKQEHNNAYLILMAMCRNLYAHVIEVFATRHKGLSVKYRIKKFIFRFVTIPAKWIRQARQWKLKLYSENYQLVT